MKGANVIAHFGVLLLATLNSEVYGEHYQEPYNHNMQSPRETEIDGPSDAQFERELVCLPDGFFCLAVSWFCCGGGCTSFACSTPTPSPTASPTQSPTTSAPTTAAPTSAPTTASPTSTPTTASPTTLSPTTHAPTSSPTTHAPTSSPTTASPTTPFPTSSPTTASPTTPFPTAPPSATTDLPNLFAVLQAIPETSTFASFIAGAQLEGIYEDLSGTNTIFAPSNSALSNATQDAPILFSTPENIKMVLEFHRIPGHLLDRADLIALDPNSDLTTALSTKTVRVQEDGAQNIFLLNAQSPAQVTTFDIPARNGIIHIIDTTLIPTGIVFADTGADLLPYVAMIMGEEDSL